MLVEDRSGGISARLSTRPVATICLPGLVLGRAIDLVAPSCRWLDDDIAHTTANDGAGVGTKFISYSIDYRLACTYGDPRTIGIPLYYLRT